MNASHVLGVKNSVALANAFASMVLWLLTFTPANADDSPVTMTVVPNNKVSLQAFGQPLAVDSSSDPINKSVQGKESSQCQPYGRQSSATGQAAVNVVKHDWNWYSVTLNADAFAHGGHYRTCSLCAANQCVGIYGNDTTGGATSSASAVVTITFDPQFKHPGDYTLGVTSTGTLPAISLTDNAGKAINAHGKDGSGSGVTLSGTPGGVYYLTASLPVAATNDGGCCEDHHATTATVDLRLTKAPILFAGYEVGYIRGGQQTTGYKNVGVILLDGKVHCSGTVVGKHTVLTAAHCLQGYDYGKMTFVLGSNYMFPFPNGGPLHAVSATYPDGSDGVFNFNPKTFEDDIGLLFISESILADYAVFHQALPAWDTILNSHVSLLFVGFGFNVIAGDTVGLGVKREGAWEINHVSNRTVSFAVQGFNTCFGDSGGPAFVENAQKLLLAAVTSGGDETCTQGIETRTDAYATWLAGRIK